MMGCKGQFTRLANPYKKQAYALLKEKSIGLGCIYFQSVGLIKKNHILIFLRKNIFYLFYIIIFKNTNIKLFILKYVSLKCFFYSLK